MKDKLDLQKQYIEVKKKYDELSNLYWSVIGYLPEDWDNDEYLKDILQEVKQEFLLLKSLHKQIYYEG